MSIIYDKTTENK
jgi:hypothetical protein